MQIPSSVIQVADSVAGRLEGLPLVLPGPTEESQAKAIRSVGTFLGLLSVFTGPVANYTGGFPFLWNELPVLVTFESDWRKAKEILQRIADEEAMETSHEAERTLRETTRRFLIHYRKLTPVVYTSVLDSGVLLTLRYLTHPRMRRGTAEAIWEKILDAFAREESIDFAHPTHRVYLNPRP